MDILLGLDLGTTNLKALAIGADAQPVAAASQPTPIARVESMDRAGRIGGPEYDAEALWQASARLIREVVHQLGERPRVAALAIASMGEASVLVDASGQPLAPVITWHDRRPMPWTDWWRERLTDQELYAITGLPLGHTFSASKLLWYRQEYAGVWPRARTWLSLADWLTFCLTRERTTSYSQASRTMLFDLRTRAWSDDLLRLADLPAGLMPPAFPSGQVVGRVTPEAARATGLPVGMPVVTGGHDHICAALAAGVIAPGRVLDSTGTTEAILVTLDAPLLDGSLARSGLCCGCHTARHRYYLVGGMMSGGVVGWLSRILGDSDDAATVARLMDEAASAAPGAGGVWFVPYLGDSGPPRRDPDAWGAWLGLRLSHSRPQLVRAAMEGLSFAIRYLFESIVQAAGSPAAELYAVGGGVRNEFWQQLKADVLGISIRTPAVADVAAQGAALLAGIGAGTFATEDEAAALSSRPARVYDVHPNLHARYDVAYRDVYRNLYPALRALPVGRYEMGRTPPP